jgi:hypothetical protein
MTQTVTRVNGSNTTVGTLYTPNSNLYVIQVKTASANVDLRLEDSTDSDGAGADVAKVDGIVENIVKELCPLAWFTKNGNTGYMYVVMDKAINDAAEIQTRIRRIGSATDISGTTVAVATTLTLAI